MEVTDDVAAVRPQRGRPVAASDAARRALLVGTGRALFLRHGYGRTTMDMVAARARVSKQTLYRLFPGKVALFEAIVADHRHSMLALPGDYDHLSLDEALAAIFHADIDEVENRERMALITMAIAETTAHPEVGRAIRDHGADRSRADLAAWLVHESDRGRLGAIDDPLAHAHILMDMVFGLPAFHPEPCLATADTTVLRTHIRRCIGIFLRGMTRPDTTDRGS